MSAIRGGEGAIAPSWERHGSSDERSFEKPAQRERAELQSRCRAHRGPAIEPLAARTKLGGIIDLRWRRRRVAIYRRCKEDGRSSIKLGERGTLRRRPP